MFEIIGVAIYIVIKKLVSNNLLKLKYRNIKNTVNSREWCHAIILFMIRLFTGFIVDETWSYFRPKMVRNFIRTII